MRCLTVFAALVAILGCSPLSAQTETRPPLPGDLNIVPPGPAVPTRLVASSGVWEGVWSGVKEFHGKQLRPGQGGREVAIAIEKIEPPHVMAVYAWGSYGGKKEGWRRLRGGISGDNILLEWGDDSVIQVTLKPTGNPRLIEATFVGDNYTMTATLKKR